MGVVTGRRWLLIATAGVVLALAAVTLVIFGPGSDPYHQTAEQVTSHAGIPAGVTPGPPP